MAKVSIIIPTYNVETYVEKCITSCLEQSLKDIEILVIDDGSSDRTRDILMRIKEKDERVTLVFQNNSGVSVARNKGIELSSSEWIMFVDSDDWLEANAAEVLYKHCVRSDADICVSNFYCETKGNSKKDSFLNIKNKRTFYGNEIIELIKGCITIGKYSNSTCSTNIGVPWAKMYRKSFLESKQCRFEIGLQRMQDMIFNIYCFNRADRIVFIPYETYHYRRTSASVTKKYNPSFLETAKHLVKCMEVFRVQIGDDSLNETIRVKKTLLFLEWIKLCISRKESPLSTREKIQTVKKELNSMEFKDLNKNINNKAYKLSQKIGVTLLTLKCHIALILYYRVANYIRDKELYR